MFQHFSRMRRRRRKQAARLQYSDTSWTAFLLREWILNQVGASYEYIYLRVIFWGDVSVWSLDWNHNRLRDFQTAPPWNHFSFMGHVPEIWWMTYIQMIGLYWCLMQFWFIGVKKEMPYTHTAVELGIVKKNYNSSTSTLNVKPIQMEYVLVASPQVELPTLSNTTWLTPPRHSQYGFVAAVANYMSHHYQKNKFKL